MSVASEHTAATLQARALIMDSLFAQLDDICPENLFTFLANSETVCGSLTPFALPLLKYFPTLEDLVNAPPAAVQQAADSLGMSAELVAIILDKRDKPDTRFANISGGGQVVKPMPRWTLLLADIFELLDADKSGTLDLGEYLALGSDPMAPLRFAIGDRDGSGSIDKAEFIAFHMEAPPVAMMTESEIEGACIAMKNYLIKKNEKYVLKSQMDRKKLLTMLFMIFDADGDGEVDYEEYQSYSTTPEMAALMDFWFSFMDSMGNSDGKITLDEWINVMSMLNVQMTDVAFEKWMMRIVTHIKQCRAAGM